VRTIPKEDQTCLFQKNHKSFSSQHVFVCVRVFVVVCYIPDDGIFAPLKPATAIVRP